MSQSHSLKMACCILLKNHCIFSYKTLIKILISCVYYVRSNECQIEAEVIENKEIQCNKVSAYLHLIANKKNVQLNKTIKRRNC